MKKHLALIICLAMVFCLCACANEDAESETATTAEYTVGSHTVTLPSTYEMQDLEEVKAEANGIAMLKDKEGNYPNLWIYEDPLNAADLSAYVEAQKSVWNFDEMEVMDDYIRIEFDEDWYGEALFNEFYYTITESGTVIGFDFAYPADADKEANHAKIVEVASMLGFN